MESTDPSALHTAIRETQEEIGFDLTQAESLGALDDVHTVSALPRLAARPFVFRVPRVHGLTLNREVASIHRLSLQALLNDEGRTTMPFTWQGQSVRLPCVDFAGQRLWGMTLRMVDDLLHRIDGRGTGMSRLPGPRPRDVVEP